MLRAFIYSFPLTCFFLHIHNIDASFLSRSQGWSLERPNNHVNHAERNSRQFYLPDETASNDIKSTVSRRGNNVKARDIICLVESTGNNLQENKEAWTKARNYIYHASSEKSKNPLTLTQVKTVLDFLEEIFEGEQSFLIPFLLQNIPRILRKNVTSYLSPNIKLLKTLFPENMFFEAIQRNPNLLLTRGVGYNYMRCRNDKVVMGSSRMSSGNGGGEFQSTSGRRQHNNEMDVASFLESEKLGMTSNHILLLKNKYPLIFQLSVEKISSFMDFLYSSLQVPDFKMRQNVIGKMIRANPNILSLSVESNLVPKIRFLKEYCGYACDEDLLKTFNKVPGILGLSLDENLIPTLRLLLQVLNTTQTDVRDFDFDYYADDQTLFEMKGVKYDTSVLHKCIKKHPGILLLSRDNLLAKMTYFNDIEAQGSLNCINEAPSLASKILTAAPSVYSLSLESNIFPTIKCLANLWGFQSPSLIGIRKKSRKKTKNIQVKKSETLAKRIYDYPNVLTLSLEGNIQPTINFYNRTGYVKVDQDGRSESSNTYMPSRYLGSSLFNRLLPRWNYYVSIETERSNSGFEANPIPPLHLLAGAPDDRYCEKLGYSLKSFLKFKEEMSPKLKFSSQWATWLKTGRPIDIELGANKTTW